MKKFMTILLSLAVLFPSIVMAAGASEVDANETQVKDLKETVEATGLTFKAIDYKESSDQVVVYLFRMTTCDHCHEAVSFFNDIAEEYGEKFKMRSFEISDVPANNQLYKRVTDYLELKAGVPLIIIGESYFRGFNSDNEEQIKKAIDKNYSLSEKYDIFEEMEKNDNKKGNTAAVIMFAFLGVVVIVLLVFFLKK